MSRYPYTLGASEADVLAALADTHLYLDPSISTPIVRVGSCPMDRARRQVPGSSLVICTPQDTYLYRAPDLGIGAPRLAWGPKPPAGWRNVGAWGNTTLNPSRFIRPAQFLEQPGILPQPEDAGVGFEQRLDMLSFRLLPRQVSLVARPFRPVTGSPLAGCNENAMLRVLQPGPLF